MKSVTTFPIQNQKLKYNEKKTWKDFKKSAGMVAAMK